MPEPDRTLYKKLKQREYRAATAKGRPRETLVKASPLGVVSLNKAGVRKGATYTATPQIGGAILLTPTKENDQ